MLIASKRFGKESQSSRGSRGSEDFLTPIPIYVFPFPGNSSRLDRFFAPEFCVPTSLDLQISGNHFNQCHQW
jgi:hypothetical protein